MIILVGESASGKSSVEKELEKKGYKRVISCTTRAPREGEIDGVDYHFLTTEEFYKMKDDMAFAEIGYYNGWWYGSLKRDIEDKSIMVLTPHGLRQIKKAIPILRIKKIDVHSIYIKVPRRDRLIKILQRGDNIEEAYRRNLSDVGQFDGIEDEVDLVVENKEYHFTPKEIADLVLSKL